ncbi:MAG: hypothetical protein Q4D81_14760, partial [Eubacteriales bacterium]|nr:hypothetical protein [Eubacteriales bacterium]
IVISEAAMQTEKESTGNPEIYKSWIQAEYCYNVSEAWPKELFPEAKYTLFRECGCLVTSMAIMLRHFGIEKEENELLFNPWVFNQRLIAENAFLPSADLNIEEIRKLYPLVYIGYLPYSKENLLMVIRTGQPFLITVPGVRGARHFVVPDHLTEDDMAVIDCAWEKKFLSEFDEILEIRVFHAADIESPGDSYEVLKKHVISEGLMYQEK